VELDNIFWQPCQKLEKFQDLEKETRPDKAFFFALFLHGEVPQ